MKRVIVIPARYASSRLPGKPLALIAGKPLIRWVYESASGSMLKDEILIATDDTRIQEAARSFGANVVMTSADCVSGTDRVFEAVRGLNADNIVNVQGDEPLIRGDMIDGLFSVLENEPIDMATLCSPLSDRSELTDPHTVKVVLDSQGFALYFSRSPIPFLQKSTDVTPYKHIGIYGFSRAFLETFVSLPKGKLEETESLEQLRALEAGHKIRVLVTDYHGVSIDTIDDLERARSILA
jgi:3-deoxy-manno-octulosonate cytidylyltransferase (CMP-KDO synthetase)